MAHLLAGSGSMTQTLNVAYVSAIGEVQEQFTVISQLGPDGCLVKADEAFGLGALLRLRIMMGVDAVSPLGKVIYERDARNGSTEVGVLFMAMTQEETRALHRFIAERLASPGKAQTETVDREGHPPPRNAPVGRWPVVVDAGDSPRLDGSR